MTGPNTIESQLREENREIRRQNMQLQKEVERLRAALRIREGAFTGTRAGPTIISYGSEEVQLKKRR